MVSDPNCLQGATTGASYSLAAISPQQITLSGASSTDDSQVTEYRFTLLPPIPGGATSSALSDNNQRITQSLAKLTIPSGVTGTFRLGLQVFDDCGRGSANTSVMVINIFP